MVHKLNMIDDLSFKIMTELFQDGRSSNAKLAKKLGVNVSTVAKRTQALLKNNIITIKALPNAGKLGYRAHALIGLEIVPNLIDEIYNRLIENPHINLALSTFGRFDILLLANLREWEMLNDFLKNDLKKIEGVNNIETYLISEAKKWYEGMFKDKKDECEVSIDETNELLIRELMKNGRANYSDLSKKLGISISTISKRIDFLIKKGIIKIMAIPNPQKLGYSVDALVAVRCELGKIDDICTKLSGYSEIHMLLTLMNGYDILFGIHSPNPSSLYQFLKANINSIDGILHTETFIRGNYLYFSPDAMFGMG